MRVWLLLSAAALATVAPPQRGSLFDHIRTSSDVAWLESLAGDAEAARQATPPQFLWKSTKEQAYIRLGAIGSVDAIAAARRIETAARDWPLVPPTVTLVDEIHPASHFGDRHPMPFATVAGPGGSTYALFALDALGGRDVFLAVRPPGSASWARPLLVPNRTDLGLTEPALTWMDSGHLRLDFRVPTDPRQAILRVWNRPPSTLDGTRQHWDISVSAVRHDADGDGWTDIEEARLGLRPDDRDSDSDGIPDGEDVCPNYAATPTESADPEVAILQKVFFAAYGIHESPFVLLVNGRSRPIQLWGSRGPVLFGVDRSEWIQRFGAGPPELSWKVTQLDGRAGTAIVTFSDFEGAMAAGGYTATLRRIDGDWFVVSVTENWIS